MRCTLKLNFMDNQETSRSVSISAFYAKCNLMFLLKFTKSWKIFNNTIKEKVIVFWNSINSNVTKKLRFLNLGNICFWLNAIIFALYFYQTSLSIQLILNKKIIHLCLKPKRKPMVVIKSCYKKQQLFLIFCSFCFNT